MSTAHGGRGGATVKLSSVTSRLGGPAGGSAYAAAKGAIGSLLLALAQEVGPEDIRVNAPRPGLIAIVDGVAAAALWLASDATAYVHGAVVDVVGGR